MRVISRHHYITMISQKLYYEIIGYNIIFHRIFALACTFENE